VNDKIFSHNNCTVGSEATLRLLFEFEEDCSGTRLVVKVSKKVVCKFCWFYEGRREKYWL